MNLPANPVIGCCGGGVDSTALVAIDLNRTNAAAYLGISPDTLNAAFPSPDVWLFSDTGAEHTGTYENVATLRGLLGDRFHTVRREGENILDWCLRLGIVPLMPGASHICSLKFKGEIMQAWARNNGVTAATWLIGIEANEGARAKRFQKPRKDPGSYRYPLIDLGLDREACERILSHLGWDAPIKSSCVFCPFKSIEELRWMYFHDREAWSTCESVENAFRVMSGVKHQAWIDAGKPLTQGKRPRAPRGMWRIDSWAEGARLFAKKVNGEQLSMQEWAEWFESEREIRNDQINFTEV